MIADLRNGAPCPFTLILDLRREVVLDSGALAGMSKAAVAAAFRLESLGGRSFEEMAAAPYLPFCAESRRIMRELEDHGRVLCPCLDGQHETWNFGSISSKICHYYEIPAEQLRRYFFHS